MRRPEQSGRAMEKNKSRGEGGWATHGPDLKRLLRERPIVGTLWRVLHQRAAGKKNQATAVRSCPTVSLRVQVLPQRFVLFSQAQPPRANLARSCSTNDITEPERHF